MTTPTVFETISDQPEATDISGLFVAAESQDPNEPTNKVSLSHLLDKSSEVFNYDGLIYKGVGNISDFAGQQLQDADKTNAYQYPDNSRHFYAADKSQAFPITIPANPSSDSGWVLVGAVTTYSLSGLTSYQAASVANMIAGVTVGGIAVNQKVGDSWRVLNTSEEIQDYTIQSDNKGGAVSLANGLYARPVDKVLTDANAYPEISQVELVDGTGWMLAEGWTGSLATGFTHEKGGGYTGTLERSLGISSGKVYEVTLRVVSPESTKASNSGWTISLGGSGAFEMYEGNFTDHVYNRGIKSLGENTSLVIKPENGFNGTISEISVKEITGTRNEIAIVRDSDGVPVLATNPTDYTLQSVYLGKSNAIRNTTGKQNVAVGYNCLQENTTGFWNVAIGLNSLGSNTVGSRSIAIGYAALAGQVGGHRNIALGSFCMNDIRDGHNNIGIGADTMERNLDGHGNVAIGLGNCSGGDDINGNVAIGYTSMVSVKTSYNVSMGYEAGYKLDTGNEQIAIGHRPLRENLTGSRNLVIGHNTLKSTNATAPSRNLIVGTNSCVNAGNIGYNTIIGHNTCDTLTTGDFNIVIGYLADVANANAQYELNIGNLIYGRMQSTQRRVGIDVTAPLARLHLPSGKSSQFGAPMRIDAGVLTTSAEDGALERDAERFYLTNESLQRFKIAVTPDKGANEALLPVSVLYETLDGALKYKREDGTYVTITTS